jgi:hypothetical protein
MLFEVAVFTSLIDEVSLLEKNLVRDALSLALSDL